MEQKGVDCLPLGLECQYLISQVEIKCEFEILVESGFETLKY